MSSEVVIQASNLSKAYAIYKRPEDRLKQMVWQLIWSGKKKYYDEFWALKDVSLDVRRGETIGVIGRNGSGKSTFLQLVCGTLQPTCGSLNVEGRIGALLELGAGFNPEFTGKENVYLSASILGLSKEEIDSRYQSILDFSGIGDFINQPVKLYSSGMFARLAFAVVSHVDADILIIDEILSVGDVSFNQKCMRYIEQFKKNGTLFFVSHDTGAVIRLCDRVIWLENGIVREIGNAKEVCHNYLASLLSEQEDGGSFKIGGARTAAPREHKKIEDPRHQTLKDTSLKNEIELFEFNPNAPWFGAKGAEISKVSFESPSGEPLTNLEGGEEVVLKIHCTATVSLKNPIVGFFLRDRLGQHLFGDNTYLSHAGKDLSVQPGKAFSAQFRFQLPYLPTGDYSFIVAVADGTQNDNTVHLWIDDALFFRVHSSHIAQGLIGIPMLGIDLVRL